MVASFEYINVETGVTTDLWRRFSNSFALDNDRRLFAVSTDCQGQGTFLVDWNGTVYIKISETPIGLAAWGGEFFSFLGYDGEQVRGIDRYGSMKKLSDNYFIAVSVSPDNHWYVLYQDPQYSYSITAGLDLFTGNNQYHRTISDQFTFPVAWSPDSTGLFYNSYGFGGLYYVSIPDGHPLLIDDCMPTGCRESFVWIP